MAHALSRGAFAFGLDSCPEMLAIAARKNEISGRLIQADMRSVPLASGTADLAICSFGLGYLETIDDALSEMARVARRVVVSDLHPLAVRAGWSRSFRCGVRRYEIQHHPHSMAALSDAARSVGLTQDWKMEARFGEPERTVFEGAGKGELFSSAQQTPAVFAVCWKQP